MKKIIVSILLLAAMPLATQAGLVLGDTFSYTDGDLVGNGNWAAHSGTTTLIVSNGEAVVNGANSQDVNALLQGATLSGGGSTPYCSNCSSVVLYSSFDITYITLPTHAFQYGAYIAHYKGILEGASTQFGDRIWASGVDTNLAALDPGTYRLGIINGSYAATSGSQDVVDSTQFPTNMTTNVTYKVVTRFVPSTGIARMWIDPGDESDFYVEGVDADPTTIDNRMDVYAYCLRQANSGQGLCYIDNLKVGTHFFDVAGTNTPPLISTITDQSIAANSATPALAFTVQDDNTPASSLVLSNYSDNPTLVPNDVSHIAFGGSGTNRTITITAATSQQGLATIHVYASDPTYTSEGTFVVKVGYPVISSIANQITAMNTATPAVAVTVGDSESAASSLNLTRTSSSNPALIPNDGSHIAFGGSASNRTVTITPVSGQTGVSTVTVSVDDGARTNSSSFSVTVKQAIGTVFSDNFSYTSFSGAPAGTNSLWGADGGGANGTPTGPWNHSTGGNHQLTVDTNAGAAELNFAAGTELMYAALTNGPYNGSTGAVLYAGFKVLFKQLPGPFGNYFATFKETNTTGGQAFRARVFASTTNAATGQFRLGLANNNSSQTAQFSRDLSLNVPYIVVTRCNFATGEGWLWVNPVNESSSNVGATDNLGSGPVGYYALRDASGIGLLDLDNLVVAGSFASVLPSVPSSPPTLNKAPIGTNLVLTWSNPTSLLSLQSAATVDGPYLDITNAVSPYTNAVGSGQKYFRLKY